MGQFFTNIHIKKDNKTNINNLNEKITNLLMSNGFKLEDKNNNADGKITLYTENNSKWITIFSDFFEINESNDFKKFYELLNIKTDFLGIFCYDSDYVGLNVINDNEKIDAWINIGSLPEIKYLKKNNFTNLENKINNLEKFKDLTKKEYIFAEDFLDNLNEFFHLPLKQIYIQSEDDINKSDNIVYEIYFSINYNKTKELPKLELLSPTLTPCIPGETQVISAYNNGGESKGLSIIIFGNFAEKDEITFTETYFHYIVNNQVKLIPIELKKVSNNNGLWGYKWTDENFYLPPKVNENIPPSKKQNMIFDNSFGIRFIPNGNNRKFLDIKVCFSPEANLKKGQCTWYVWKNYPNKRTFLETSNQTRISENRGTFPQDILGIYNLDDYDLD